MAVGQSLEELVAVLCCAVRVIEAQCVQVVAVGAYLAQEHQQLPPIFRRCVVQVVHFDFLDVLALGGELGQWPRLQTVLVGEAVYCELQ